MAHRSFPYPSRPSGMDHIYIRNHPNPDPRFLLGNNSFVPPMDNTATSGVNFMTYDIAQRANSYPTSSFSLDYLNYRPANPGESQNMHSSSVGGCLRLSPNHAPHMPCYSRPIIGDGCNTVNPQSDNRTATFKRKSPAMPLVAERANVSGYNCPGSSSNFPIFSDYLQPKPIPGPQCQLLDSDSMDTVPSYRSDNLSIVEEGSRRNVRSRYDHAFHFEHNPAGICPSSSMSHHSSSTGSTSGPCLAEQRSHTFHSGYNPAGAYPSSNMPHHSSSTGSMSCLNMAGQWSQNHVHRTLHGRTLLPETGHLSSELNQSLGESNINNGTAAMNVAYHPSIIQNRNLSSPLPNLLVPSSQDQSNYDRRMYRTISSHPLMRFAATSPGPAVEVESSISSRQSRPLSILRHGGNGRGERVRNFHNALHSLLGVDNARDRWVSEGIVMIDQLPFYYPSDLFDQYRDMRLDIDNMSYEELLALEESMGNVSTGLSEERISTSLVETVYCSSQIHDDVGERSCAICLEEYKDGDNLGGMKCGHDFHVSCIKKWLEMKNVCPFCKASALEDISKEKQISAS